MSIKINGPSSGQQWCAPAGTVLYVHQSTNHGARKRKNQSVRGPDDISYPIKFAKDQCSHFSAIGHKYTKR